MLAVGGVNVLRNVQSAIQVTNATPNVSTTAATNVATRALIRALTANNGTVWLDFGTAAVSGACFELTAGDSTTVPLSNTDEIRCLFTTGGDKVTILFEK